MSQVFLKKTARTAPFFSICLLIILFAAFGCQPDQKNTAKPENTSQTTVPVPDREEVAATEDYSAYILEVAKKEYEPLGRKILANREQIKALKAADQSDAEIGNGLVKEQEKNQSKVEADFVENMKILDYLVEKQNSGEMPTKQIEADRKQIAKNILEIEATAAKIETALKNPKN